VTAYADSLLATASPEPSLFLAKYRAVSIEQREANGSINRSFYEERTIGLDWRRAGGHHAAIGTERLQSH